MAKPEVHPDAYGALNSEFYGGSPGQYFEMRLRSLLTMVSDESAGLAGSGRGKFEELEFSFGPDPSTDIDRYVALESTVLLHHTAEALLRLYLGHAFQQPCPWVAIASLRSFAKFKDDVSRLRTDLDSATRQDDLLEVFSARSDRAQFALNDEEMDLHRQGLAIALREAAITFLGDSNIYNAAKHGLALIAGESGMTITANDGSGRSIGQSGIALVTLEVSDDRWRERTTWLEIKRSIGLIFLWTELIQSLWESARMRYLGEGDASKLRRLNADELRMMLAERKNKAGLISWSMDLLHVDEGDLTRATRERS
ncbi:MAG: hypothetical protein ACTHNQ_10360 [Microbacterium sp.]|uniref:hypothetical protein n=1 Tax=Microbacterium sp. TaxID=51671 RepID=UPI003F7E3182